MIQEALAFVVNGVATSLLILGVCFYHEFTHLARCAMLAAGLITLIATHAFIN